MELVEGGTLRDVLRARGALGVPAAFAVMEPVLAGLAEAHRLGLVHRDVKPENVLISRAGEVKVADFGLVTAAAQAGASHAGMIMGTVAYLSPEQVATGQADQRSDVYAAGVLLYELLTGAPPYTGDTAISVAYRHVNSDVPAPSLIAGDVPPELDDLVRRATRRDPAARPVDAAAMLAELRRVAVRLEVPRVLPPVPPPRPIEEQDTVPAGPRRVDAGTGTHRIGAPVPAAVRAGRHPHDAAPARRRPRRRDHHPAVAGHEPPPHLRARRRSRRVFAAWIAIVLVLALLVGLTAWWLGVGRWTAMPAVIGLEQTTAQQLARRGRPRRPPHRGPRRRRRGRARREQRPGAGGAAAARQRRRADGLGRSPHRARRGSRHRRRRRRTGRARRRAHTRAGDGRQRVQRHRACRRRHPHRPGPRGRRCRSARRSRWWSAAASSRSRSACGCRW